MNAVRESLSRHLVGRGVEVGPGHQPFPMPYPGASVTYVDRWAPDQNRELFPELPADAEFPVPDVVTNLDTDRLAPLLDGSQDFVVASHVLEHVAEPIGLLDEIHRVLRPGGVGLILLPDRHRTFDAQRAPTTLDHLVAEYEAGIQVVDDEHVADFLLRAGEGASYLDMPEDEAARRAFFDWHRRRSIHVHCWDADGFVPVIVHGIVTLGQTWDLVDAVLSDDEGPDGMEFGFVLRRSAVELEPAVRGDRFEATWKAWRAEREAAHGRLSDETTRADAAAERAAAIAADLAAVQDQLAKTRARRAVRIADRLGRLVRAVRR